MTYIGAHQETAWRKKYKAMEPEALTQAIEDMQQRLETLPQAITTDAQNVSFARTTRELEIARRVQAVNANRSARQDGPAR